MISNVSNLETDEVKIKENLGSTKHELLNTNENYVKDKDQLVRIKTDISGRHETASVKDFFLC